MTSLNEARRDLAARLETAGIADAAIEAKYLLAAATGLEGASLIAEGHREFTTDEADRLEAMAARRLAREPLAHILGNQPFWTLDLEVSPDVLIPRTDTETLVETALDLMPSASGIQRVLDVGTGSGAVLLAILKERPNAYGIGTDVSPAALTIAERNAVRNGLDGRSSFRQTSWVDGLRGGDFDLAVSNPPYIATAVIAGLEPEVRDHDPALALDGGEDGLDAYRVLLPELFRILKPGAPMAVEIGFDQAASVSALAGEAGFTGMAIRRDLGGNDRVVSALKPK
ncbi:peptide chain release factor N(5)-glutamine methyltransferase [Hyphobacterium sp. SN044]|uniref:peptide chain release factor N(5)-glutamine methyltransferase n=1 Tax=Hyphobacterium sp. SN044 TaxID=2912575 RepID=UPI001F01BDA2|nr:peptide chain release factor N(5)-glutamine methyltransferase [Hyphobacterium sp. SN044]MCF8880746.1 peptide chain release factor N(5)-glutamine methyltransferase [Hyphobacterium sp. SN044]